MVKLDPRLGLAGSPPVMDCQHTFEAADQVILCSGHAQSKGSLHAASAERNCDPLSYVGSLGNVRPRSGSPRSLSRRWT